MSYSSYLNTVPHSDTMKSAQGPKQMKGLTAPELIFNGQVLAVKLQSFRDGC